MAAASAVVVAADLVRQLGYRAQHTPPDLLRYVQAALARGDTPEALAACAADVADMPPDEIETTALKVLTGLIRKRNNAPVPSDGTPHQQGAAGPSDSWSAQWTLCRTRGPSGANAAAKRAWHDSRQIRRYDTETNAKFAFRDAYLLAAATPVEATA